MNCPWCGAEVKMPEKLPGMAYCSAPCGWDGIVMEDGERLVKKLGYPGP